MVTRVEAGRMDEEPTAAAVRAGIAAHRDLYLRSGGAQGHVVLGGAAGADRFTTNLLIRFRGRRSGSAYITPLTYGHVGAELVVVASKGGADAHPDWYLNIREAPEIEFQIAAQAFRGAWREPQGAERETVWRRMVDCYPFYAAYQAATARIIPLVMIRPITEIPAFAAEGRP
jgi:deazaflavin-dependent oxidoreductase (nitroreductase family)